MRSIKAKQRRNFSAEFKARIALEAIKGQRTVQEIASHYGVHPNHYISSLVRQTAASGNKVETKRK